MAGIHRKTKPNVKKAVQTVKQRLIALISILGVGVAILFFKIGETWWPQGLMDYRLRIIGVLVFALLIVTASFPLFIESAKRPRTYPGLGKNPYIDR